MLRKLLKKVAEKTSLVTKDGYKEGKKLAHAGFKGLKADIRAAKKSYKNQK